MKKIEVKPKKSDYILYMIIDAIVILIEIVLIWGIGVSSVLFFLGLLIMPADLLYRIISLHQMRLVVSEEECYYSNAFGRKTTFSFEEITWLNVPGANGRWRLRLKDKNGRVIAKLLCNGSLENMEEAALWIRTHSPCEKE